VSRPDARLSAVPAGAADAHLHLFAPIAASTAARCWRDSPPWVPDARQRRHVLVDTPAELFGFG